MELALGCFQCILDFIVDGTLLLTTGNKMQVDLFCLTLIAFLRSIPRGSLAQAFYSKQTLNSVSQAGMTSLLII